MEWVYTRLQVHTKPFLMWLFVVILTAANRGEVMVIAVRNAAKTRERAASVLDTARSWSCSAA